MVAISFKPTQTAKKLLSVLRERDRDVLTRRYGLGPDVEKMTLEAIGEVYGITRERVRQVENFALGSIKKSEIFSKEQVALEDLRVLISSLGGVVGERDLLEYISKNEDVQNNVTFLMVLGDSFSKKKECKHFKHRWVVDEEISQTVEESLKALYENLSDDDLISEGEMIASFLDHLKDISEKYKNEEILKRWLALSKTVAKNPLDEWGIATSPNINARGIRDYAFLVIRDHGSPMHFTEVSKAVSSLFKKKAHIATCHNELIKDKRFVLVGRGLYALSEWGYEGGVVKDVIRKIIEKVGPMTKDEIIEKVLKERYVKANTVVVNLQDIDRFKKDEAGRYSLR
ncbi:MAG: hypothetical protein BMS9Abin13_429 [Patescibacteria group bacterium]|nr:MAG: hypothetical protein BMS9Abin13_429 [Patescibacteria group bacterium]